MRKRVIKKINHTIVPLIIWHENNRKLKHITFHTYLLFLLSVITSVDTLAENTVMSQLENTDSEEAFFAEIPNIISATRIHQPLTEAPSSVTVITRDMIEASGAIEVADVLRQVPGMLVAYPSGNSMAVAYHGFSDAFPKRMQVLVDGRSVHQPSFSGIDWLNIGVSLDDIDRIEVVRGANSPLFGASSVLGIINIITRQPYQVMGTKLEYTGGSLGTRFGAARFAGKMKNMDYRITAKYQSANGFPGDIDSTNDGREIAGLSFRGVYENTLNDEVDIQLGLDRGNLGAGIQASENQPAHDKIVKSNFQSIKWRHTYQNSADFQLHLYHNYYQSEDKYRVLLSEAFGLPPSAIPLLFGGIADQVVNSGLYNFTGERYNLEWKYNTPKKGKLRSMVGVGIQQNRYRSLFFTNQDKWIEANSLRLFFNTQYRPNKSMIAGLGLMIDDSNQFEINVSPRVSFNYLMTPEQSIRFSYTQIKRNPSLLDNNFKLVFALDDGTQFFESIRSLEMEAETISSTEIGFVGYWLERRLFLDVKIFREQIKDVIHSRVDSSIAQPSPNPVVPGVRVLNNDGTLTTKGIELQIKYQVAPKDFFTVQASYLDPDSTLTSRVNDTALWQFAEPSIPSRTISAMFSHRFSSGYEASVMYYENSDINWLGFGDLIKDYQRWDMRIAKSWFIGRKRLTTEFIVHNLGGDNYSFQQKNLLETQYYLRLKLEL